MGALIWRAVVEKPNHRHRWLLRARRERPRRSRAAEKRDEVAPFHYPMPPVLPTERIARLRYGTRLLRCGISARLRTGLGQIRSSDDVHCTTALPPKADLSAPSRHVT